MPVSLDNGFDLFANWQTVVVGLTIYVITVGVRRIIETAWKGATMNKWWCEVILPLSPIVSGVTLAVGMKKFPWPPPVAGSLSARITYAIVCGLFCGWLYGRVRGFFRSAQQGNALAQGLDAPVPSLEDPPVVEAPAVEASAAVDAPNAEAAPPVVEDPSPAPKKAQP